MRKIFTFFFALIVTANLWAYHDFKSGDCYYNILSNTPPYTVQVAQGWQIYEGSWAIIPYVGDIVIPDSVIYNNICYKVVAIQDLIFANCPALTSVKVGNNIRIISKHCFANNPRLKKVFLPESITTIGEEAFAYCDSLQTINIPSGLTSVGQNIFKSSPQLDTVIWNLRNADLNITPLKSNKAISVVTIGDSVTTIGESAFYGCTNLSEVYWSKQLKTIGKSAFSASGIRSAILPEGIDSIASSAFSNCSKLKVVSIPSSLRYVNGWDHDDNTESFNFSNNIDSVYWNAYNCVENRPFISTQNGLIRVVAFGDSIKHIPNRFCMSFSNLTNVILPKGLQSIGKEAFEQCKKLSNVEIPDSVTTIGESAFYSCTDLSKVSLGCTLNSIGKSAFYHSKKLTTVICNAVIPPTLGSNAFHTSTITFVYIPCGASDAYKASAWKDYCKNFVEPELEFTLNIYTSDTTQGIVAIEQYPTCSNDTVKFHAVPTSMYQFAQWSDGNKDNPRKLVLTQDTSLIAMFQINYIQPDMVTLCYGDTYQWNDKVYDSTGVYVDTLSNGVAMLYLTILPAAVTETEALALCPSELPYEWYGQSITEAGLYTATEQYAAGCDSVLHELILDVYLQTLPEHVTLPVVHQGEAIDVTIPTAEVQAHIAAETWYAPNALVEWYMQTLAGWEVLTTEPIKNGTSQIVLKYAVNSDCGSVESQGMIISVLTTGVENLPNGKTSPQKLIRDGQLLIMRDGKTYNAQGAAL